MIQIIREKNFKYNKVKNTEGFGQFNFRIKTNWIRPKIPNYIGREKLIRKVRQGSKVQRKVYQPFGVESKISLNFRIKLIKFKRSLIKSVTI